MLKSVPSNIMAITSLAAAAGAEPKHLMRRRWWRVSGRCQLARCGEAERALTCAPSERCGWNAGWAGAEGPAASAPPLPPLPPLSAEFSVGGGRKRTSDSCGSAKASGQHPLTDWQHCVFAPYFAALTFRVLNQRGGRGKGTRISCRQETTSSSKDVATCWRSHSHTCSLSSVKRWRSVLGVTLHEPLTHPLSWQTQWNFTIAMTRLFWQLLFKHILNGFCLVYFHLFIINGFWHRRATKNMALPFNWYFCCK